MHLQSVIERFGYTPTEARVYLTALETGESTIAHLVSKTRLPRTSVVMAVENLHKHGLMNVYERGNSKFWSPENPEKLLISSREREAALRAILPELAAKRRDTGGKPSIKVYSGTEEIKLILEDIIASKHHVCAISPWDEWLALFGQEYLSAFIASRKEHFLQIRFLVPKTKAAQKLKSSDTKELRATRFLPKDISIATAHYIYGNKIALITLNPKQPTGIIIEDADISDTMITFFEELWNRSVPA